MTTGCPSKAATRNELRGCACQHVVYGTPGSVVERLPELQEELGINQVIYEVNFGCNVPLEHQIKSGLVIE
ncbi:MAG: hypothetical protein CM1200mP27_06690 [Chloroflexota bacterium]|nr:MAG: hypothetical protein CM1200mP27_06690 [Chloroflexota bacterium]